MSTLKPPLQNGWIRIAHLIRPRGRHGEMIAEILTDFPERFATTRKALLAGAGNETPVPVSIEQSWLHKGRVVLKLAGVDSISAAEALRGKEIVIPINERVPLEPDAAYIDDLTGCQLMDSKRSDPHPVGVIEDVIRQENTPDILVVRGSNARQYWIPFAKAYQVRIDLEARRVEMNLPAGILEVDAPLSEEERHGEQPSRSTTKQDF